MGRLPKQIHFERLQVYLMPEEAIELKIEAHNKNLDISKYLRNIIINTLISHHGSIA